MSSITIYHCKSLYDSLDEKNLIKMKDEIKYRGKGYVIHFWQNILELDTLLYIMYPW